MDYILTSDGTRVDFLDPQPEQFDITVIARSLSLIHRFAGHTIAPYTVAEHSLRVAEIVEDYGGTPTECLQGLLHDAAESIISDVPNPVKLHCKYLQSIEDRIKYAIMAKYDLPAIEPNIVANADCQACDEEVYALWDEEHHHHFKTTKQEWVYRPIKPNIAALRFVLKFEALQEARRERY